MKTPRPAHACELFLDPRRCGLIGASGFLAAVASFGLPARVGFAVRRALVWVLAACGGISGSAWAQTSGDFTYTDNGTVVTITGYTGAGGTVAIPSSIGGHPVTTIADGVFNNKTAVTGISIPSSVTTVGSAFQGSGLTSLTLPGTVTSWGPYTFADCHSLVSLTIATGVTTISSEMFERCDYLTSVVFPTSITSIGWYAFYGCSRLSSVTFWAPSPRSTPAGLFRALRPRPVVITRVATRAGVLRRSSA